MPNNFKPELLSPAGSLEKLKVAIDYGADAVYLAGLKFGLRSAADNFTYVELAEGVAYAHGKDRLVYVVLNGFLHDEDLDELPEFVRYLDSLKIDAVIVSDLGVIETVKAHSSIEVHLSTQASCVNVSSAKLWKEMGVSRIVLGREISIEQAGRIKKEVGIEIEMFIHGSMCMAYSGNCVISNFTQGRDSNRGGCAHSCRFEYSLETEDTKSTSYFMSSKDLNGIHLIPKFIEHEIDSLKIEGRMKSSMYAAVMSQTYSKAINEFSKEIVSKDKISQYINDLEKVPHRTYSDASLIEPAGRDSIFDERENSKKSDHVVVGEVLTVVKDKFILTNVKNAFNHGDDLEVLLQNTDNIFFKCTDVKDLSDNQLERTNPSTLVKLPYMENVTAGNIIRMRSV